VRGLEITNVLAQLFAEVPLVLAALHVLAMDAGDVLVLEHRGHRRDALQELRDRREVALVEHAGLSRRGERVIGNRIPCAEDDVVERGKRDEITNQRRAIVGPLAEADCRHLRQRADRDAAATANALDAGHEGRCDSAKPRGEDSQAPVRRPDAGLPGHGCGEGACTAARAPSGTAPD